MTTAEGPPPRVLTAFGLAGPARRLPGGQGTSWQVAGWVLKPDVDPRLQEWLGTEVAAIPQHGFRLPRVRRALDGSWVVDGWAAESALPGRTSKEAGADWRWVLDAARALHDATAALDRPAFLDLRADAWAWADRAAWGETPRVAGQEVSELVARLDDVPPPTGPAQLIHGDLTDNVLAHPGEPPSVIDFSPYWRPRVHAEGIVIADALCWHGAPTSLLDEVGVPVSAVAKGLLFRLLTASRLHGPRSAELVEEVSRCGSVMRDLQI